MNFSIENKSQKKGLYCFVDQILRINDDAKSISMSPARTGGNHFD